MREASRSGMARRTSVFRDGIGKEDTDDGALQDMQRTRGVLAIGAGTYGGAAFAASA